MMSINAKPTPRPNPAAVVEGDRWRVTVLTDGLLRLEWAPDGVFEDRASSFAWHRDLPVPDFEVTRSAKGLTLLTRRLRLDYDLAPFSPHGLTVGLESGMPRTRVAWRFGTPSRDLGGTARTLDNVDGRLPLGSGILSRRGVGVVDDSASFLFEADGSVAPRRPGVHDLYVFAYGLDFSEALRAFYAVSGRPPLLPRWAFGNWWSRYHPYEAEEYLELFRRFEGEGVPFSVAVVDMDWHLVHEVDPAEGIGWTGYTWNRKLIPDPPGFLRALHERGLRVTLNLHPAEGIRSFEECYPAVAAAMGVDPASGQAIEFDLTDGAFRRAYFELVHHPLEAEGVDFWWIDWQQGPYSRLPGVDPLWLLNHYHFCDATRGGRRGLILSRYAGPGSHRYPIGFSGDTVISWESLSFQPEFTATAANIGYGWWSHDIGGHFGGVRDEELTLRWVQLGVFSPILRLHSSPNPFFAREPWAFGMEIRTHLRAALRFRHRLVPYLHTMNHRASREGEPLVRPIYHLHPDERAAYQVPHEFYFGSELVVAPITTPLDPVSKRAAVSAWLPPGVWTDVFTATSYDGGGTRVLHRDLESVPVLLRSGGILPLAGADHLDAAANPAHLEVVIAPGADGSFTLLEDDGTGSLPEEARVASTPITFVQATGTVRIGPASGATDAIPPRRTWTITLLGVADVARAEVDGRERPTTVAAASTQLTVGDVRREDALEVVFGPGLAPRTSGVPDRIFEVLHRARTSHETKLRAWELLRHGSAGPFEIERLHALLEPSLAAAVGELLTVRH